MKKPLTVLVALPGALFVVTGLRWLVDPASAATQFGMPLLDALGEVEELWDVVGLAVWPSRQAMREVMQSDGMKEISVTPGLRSCRRPVTLPQEALRRV